MRVKYICGIKKILVNKGDTLDQMCRTKIYSWTLNGLIFFV